MRQVMKHLSRILRFFVFPAIVLIVHMIAWKIFKVYAIYPNLDIPMHYIGGVSIAYSASRTLAYLEDEKLISRLNRTILLITIFSLTGTVTVFWELAEFLGDRFFDLHVQPSLANTMQDQFMGILGGGTWALIFDRYRKWAASRAAD
jgi:hypothetical protein